MIVLYCINSELLSFQFLSSHSMDRVENWKHKLKRSMEKNIEDLEQEHDWWEASFLSGFLSLMEQMQRSQVKKSKGGSKPGKAQNIDRDRASGHQRIWQDYFQPDPVYDVKFRRRYRMRRSLFWKIHDAVSVQDAWFEQTLDAASVRGLSSIQKLTAALRQLALGVSADAVDEYCRIGASIALESMKRFAAAVVDAFGQEYLRQPTRSDMERQLRINAERGFPGMFASIDCMHYIWRNCPVAWQGFFINKDRDKTIVLEAVADQSLWFWHAYFGLPSGNNDLNVLDRSPLVNNLLKSDAGDICFEVNGTIYNRYYLLANGIYPEWSIFAKTILLPQGDAKKWYSKCQEAARKNVERAFGVLQSRWGIVKNPVRLHSRHVIKTVLLCCVILHNMILEDEHDLDLPQEWEQEVGGSRGATNAAPRLATTNWREYLTATRMVEDSETHFQLRSDLIKHLWHLKGRGHIFSYVGDGVDR